MRPLKPVFFTLGWVFVGTGIVGIFLPVLPTTPFMLLALWMFSRSSDRFHNWLYSHPLFGPPLQRWHEHRVIPPMAKLASVSMMVLSFIYMAIWTVLPAWALLPIGLLFLYGGWFVLSKPSRIPNQG